MRVRPIRPWPRACARANGCHNSLLKWWISRVFSAFRPRPARHYALLLKQTPFFCRYPLGKNSDSGSVEKVKIGSLFGLSFAQNRRHRIAKTPRAQFFLPLCLQRLTPFPPKKIPRISRKSADPGEYEGGRTPPAHLRRSVGLAPPQRTMNYEL